ncbi:hypothetical protein [Levilactobacillus bambusae]|uniref:Uncharacterized protein n=1 Tax=Levilactobacillus bambusae TaxID=2024736 RepID=A0A2V1N065_9LACO|nr:hypothetical protein [Levilactobacillus bambusae]PWF99765.1 hypothetical protein DCM90_06805 [Levilactobacillus bambusae]
MADLTLDELNEKVDEHIGNFGSAVHATADSATSGFISGLETMTRTDTGSSPKDILTLQPGHYFGYGWYNIWTDNTQTNPYTSALAVDVYYDTHGNKIILACEEYVDRLHMYNNYGQDRKVPTVTYWRTIAQKSPLWSGNISAVGSYIPVSSLIDSPIGTTTGTMMFNKLEVSYTYLGNGGIKYVDLTKSTEISIDVVNLSNNNSAVNVAEMNLTLDRANQRYHVERNNSQIIGGLNYKPLETTQQEAYAALDTSLISILGITGVND